MLRTNKAGLPDRLGKYRVRARLGSGGMAEVYLAWLDGPAGFVKPVAIKRMRPDLSGNREFVELFLTEARTASLLAHPNICQVHELCSEGKEYYMVMEYLAGIPVTTVLGRQMLHRSMCPIGFLLGVVEQACEGIHFAHELRYPNGESYYIVHRDLSPPNLLLTPPGVVKILDFGISKSTESVVQTASGQIRGKFTYMSPEQLRGHVLDRRSDVFSLGVILYELLTGTRLFKRKTRLETFRAVSQDEIPRVDSVRKDLPRSIADVCAIALERDRERRFQTARDFAQALRRAAEPIGGVWSTSAMAEATSSIFEAEINAQRHWLSAAESGAFLAHDKAPEPTATTVEAPSLPDMVDTAAQTEITIALPGKPPGK